MIYPEELANGTALTTTPTAGTTAKIDGRFQHIIRVFWTPGTSGNVLTINPQTRCLFGASSTDAAWTPDMEWSSTPGAKTKTDNSYTHTASGTDEIGLTIIVPAGGDELRVLVSESEDGSSTKGTYKLKVYSCIA